jgi:1-acyl-sn-glycerol-3-phosphate acyltransferase
MLVSGLFTGFQSRRFYTEVLARGLARIALRFYGVRIVEHRDFPFPIRQTVYISNHTSALDMFVLISLGFPNCRYFLSGFLRKILPLWIIGWLMGIFWTAPQTQGSKRTEIFQNADRLLKRTGESVFLTPEGQITWVFNKGAFHLATSLQAPILPIYIYIPNEVDPGPWTNGDGMDVRAGDVHVYYRPEIETSTWRVEDVPTHRDQVRSMYVEWAERLSEV